MINFSITKKFSSFFFTVVVAVGCNSEADEKAEQKTDTCYAQNHEWIVAATELKEKLGLFQQDFTAIANKELEETVCAESASAPYTGNKSEMSVWVMMNYMLDNFDAEKFGQYNFGMPENKMKRNVPITALDWLNFTSGPTGIDLSLYRDHPDLKNVPMEKADSTGEVKPYKKSLEDIAALERSLKNGLFAVVAVVDYLPPTFNSATEFETGYVMGYVLLGDWESGKLSCMMPLLAENSPELSFADFESQIQEGQKAPELVSLENDLKLRTFDAIKEIVRKMTGVTGAISINSQVNGSF